MQRLRLVLVSLVICGSVGLPQGFADEPVADARPSLLVPKCDDFQVNGLGDASSWERAEWTSLKLRGGSHGAYQSQFKMLYSETGVYVLFRGEDKKLSASLQEDFSNLWTEDVFELFLWPSEDEPVYFEYEISPLGYELPILIPNFNGRFLGWRPWHYEGDRKTQKGVQIVGGKQQTNATIDAWQAEVFIPYSLLSPLQNVPPKSGTKWRGNFYRMDYDAEKPVAWDWARVGPSFHEFEKFGTIIFQ